MKDNEKLHGRIITFYSFKGGVGRTMALANVAFLAAQNGKKVLVMDWDLEAPGLSYYFRGLLDPPETRALKEAPGILDMLWGWNGSLASDLTAFDLNELKERYATGSAYESCIRPLIMPEFLPSGAKLDFIGAGSRNIPTPEPIPYEEALANFSWPTFFDQNAGGFVLNSLREWSKENYDFILLDSRTGMADVAGICTMQIPDVVALCFILNRQNIDGVAKVAGAIRTKREEAVSLRAIPMRVARTDTPEESDAKARAISELTRIGGFSSEFIAEDFRLLSIAAAENVPFYETLAPLAAQDPSLDYLTLNYLRLASKLLDIPLETPSLDQGLVESVRRRLQPRHATVEYLLKLKTAEPTRAATELARLIESAFETEMDGGGLEDDYIAALVEAVMTIDDVATNSIGADYLQTRTLDLLRLLVIGRPEKWSLLLTAAIERYIDTFSFRLDSEEALALFDELDGLLARVPTDAARLKRVTYRRRAARIFVSLKNTEAAMQTVGEILTIAKEIHRDGTNRAPDYADELLIAEVDTSLVRGDVQQIKKNFEDADYDYRIGLSLLNQLDVSPSRSDIRRLYFELHSRLARSTSYSLSPIAAAEHAVQAMKRGSGLSASIFQFLELSRVVLYVRNQPEMSLAFCEESFGQEHKSPLQLAQFYGRQPRSAIEFLSTIAEFSKIIAPLEGKRANDVLLMLAMICQLILRNLDRRWTTIGQKQRETILEGIDEIIGVMNYAGLSLEQFPDLDKARTAFKSRSRKYNEPDSE